MGRLSCLFRRHQWFEAMDPETKRTWRECRRCGVVKTTLDDLQHPARLVQATLATVSSPAKQRRERPAAQRGHP